MRVPKISAPLPTVPKLKDPGLTAPKTRALRVGARGLEFEKQIACRAKGRQRKKPVRKEAGERKAGATNAGATKASQKNASRERRWVLV